MHKKKIELQLLAEAVQGKKIVYLFRVKSKDATTDGATLAFSTENTRTKSKDADFHHILSGRRDFNLCQIALEVHTFELVFTFLRFLSVSNTHLTLPTIYSV